MSEEGRWEDIMRADVIEWQERIRAREFPWDDERYMHDFISTGVQQPHRGHDGIPGAPKGTWCARCEADAALLRLLRS